MTNTLNPGDCVFTTGDRARFDSGIVIAVNRDKRMAIVCQNYFAWAMIEMGVSRDYIEAMEECQKLSFDELVLDTSDDDDDDDDDDVPAQPLTKVSELP